MLFKNHKKLCQVLQNVVQKPIRWLNLMEFQSKNLLKQHGLATQDFCIVNKKNGFKEFDKFEAPAYVVKAQILAGGRGKGHFDNGFQGGVQIAKDKQEAKEIVNKMLGHRLITKQTQKAGILVENVMVCTLVPVEKETYLCIAMDRLCNGPIVMVSPEGGVDIEGVAAKTPQLIRKFPIDIFEGITDKINGEICDFLRFKPELRTQVNTQLKTLWKFFIKVDALQVEINPLASTRDGKVTCIDAKLNFDNNAKFRQREIFSIQNLSGQDPHEAEAEKYLLNYVKLTGDIGCLVNGAGLAMATMDIIKLFGGEPANFLDIGGAVTPKSMQKAFDIVLADKNVKVILVNIFGGIVNCAMVAKALLDIEKHLHVPVVVRLEGTNAEEGKKILEKAGAKHIEDAVDFADGAKKAVALVKK